MKRTMKICLGKGGHNKRIEERIILFLLDCWIAISSRFSGGSTVAYRFCSLHVPNFPFDLDFNLRRST